MSKIGDHFIELCDDDVSREYQDDLRRREAQKQKEDADEALKLSEEEKLKSNKPDF